MSKIKRLKKILSIIFIILMVASFLLLLYDFRDVIIEAIKIKSWDPIKQRFADFGFWSIFFISLTQALSILLTVIPGSPIQILAGISIGPVLGFIACLIGIFLGNLTIYLLVRKFGHNTDAFYENKDLDEMEKLAAKRGNRFFTQLLFVLYLIPVIPYGLIAFLGAKSKMKYPRFFLVTTFSAIPSVLLSIYLGRLLTDSDSVTMIILIVIFVLLTVMVTRHHKSIIKYLTNRPIKDMAYFQAGVRKPNPLLYAAVWVIVKLFFHPRVRVKINRNGVKKLKGPYILIYNHPSKLDFTYSISPLFPRRINAMVAYYYFCDYRLGRLIHAGGGFPKFLYHPDLSSIRSIKKIMKRNGIMAIAPEGRLSAYGCLESLAPATEKMIKRMGVPVVMAKITGAYLAFPKWSKYIRRGRVEVIFEQVLTTEEIDQMSTEEIENLLYQKLDYDDFKWQEERKIYYKGKKFAEGLEHILYYCPVCGQEYTTQTKDDHLFCTNCHTDILLNHYYEFETNRPEIPKNIRDWYLLQKQIERKNIEAEDYKLTSNVILKFPDSQGRGFSEVGSGKATLDKHGVTYQGTINGEEKEIFFKIENIPAILFGVNEDFEIYHDNTLYYFVPENIRSCAKWSVVAEQIYNKYVKEKENGKRTNTEDQ
ncbi:MAG: hypothetical protein GX661_00885 [Acholeplasmataceae bacterium]|nr:hypothetical protein [Acholeplasmataceae bacterium]